MSRKEWKELRVVPGIAQVKALTLEACFELSRRVQSPSDIVPVQMTGPKAVAAYFWSETTPFNQRGVHRMLSK